jgi:hypothetical protein
MKFIALQQNCDDGPAPANHALGQGAEGVSPWHALIRTDSARRLRMAARDIDRPTRCRRIWDPDSRVGDMLKGKRGLVVGSRERRFHRLWLRGEAARLRR